MERRDNIYYQVITNLAKPLRHFHHWIKSNLIYSYCSPKQGKKLDILDYGCGKAQHHPDSWNSYKYDPAIPQFSTKPDKNKKFDLVLCVDVLEHIPEESLPEIIKELFEYSNKWVFCTAAVKEAGKTLPNGMNAHATVKPEDWWKELFKPYKNYTLDFTTKKPTKKKKY
jgi:SAM-dependent methyltransferase